MKQAAPIGHNRTGIYTSAGRVEDMQRLMEEFAPTSTGSVHGAGIIRVDYAKHADALGSLPSGNGLDLAEADELTALLIDKLGERLAFECGGTRAYTALVSKHEAFGSFEGGPSRDDLVEILNEEHRHFHLVAEQIGVMGGDPTVVTPAADLVATISQGVMAAILDPRVNLMQSLQAILIAELADYEGWSTLTELLRTAGETALADECESAWNTEETHLTRVRTWLDAGYAGATQ